MHNPTYTFTNVIPKSPKVMEYPIIGDDFEADQVEHYASFLAYQVREVSQARFLRTSTKFDANSSGNSDSDNLAVSNSITGMPDGTSWQDAKANTGLVGTETAAELGAGTMITDITNTPGSYGGRSNTNTTSSSIATPVSVINLYQPQNLAVVYGQNWNEEEGVATEFSSPLVGKDTTGTLLGNIKGTFQQGLDSFVKAVGDAGLTKSGESMLGMVTNPRVGLLYKKTALRTFQFSFNFMPKSEKEVKMVLDIIEEFKWHAAPDIDKSYDSITNYPELWKIEFHKGSETPSINKNLFKTTWSALTNIALNYSPQGVWATFKDGMPVNIQMDLTFMEIETIDKKFIKAGF
jgi:hypothetical protein